MKGLVKKISAFLCIILATSILCSCSKPNVEPTSPEDFRVVSYIVCDDRFNEKSFDTSHLEVVTDLIIFSIATFDENGELTLADNFDDVISLIKSNATTQNLYLNILGPGSDEGIDDWNEQMYSLADKHTSAFESGKLEDSIKSVLEKYQLDGVVFDYEFPLRSKDWNAYDSFILSLRDTLGEDYKIGMSMVAWNLKQSKSAREATDFFEVMSYDLWDDDGNHATMQIAIDDIEKMVKKGYDSRTLDLGIPFYARPTTHDGYWYDYASYYNMMDENGLYQDAETGLTFSFNTYDVVYDKTAWAIDNGVGGVMIWHYACDVPADNELSLFNAIDSAINR